MADILALQSEYVVDGHRVVLKPSQRYDMRWLRLRRRSKHERREYLRSLVPADAQAMSDIEDSELPDTDSEEPKN